MKATCHAAVISRELGVPCVVGTRNAATILTDGQLVTVDGSAGTVRQGAAPRPAVVATPRATAQPVAVETTGTLLYVNLGIPERADEIAQLPVDGVGLLRAEFMLTEALGGMHPRQYLAWQGAEGLTQALVQPLIRVGQAFGTRPVIYRATDFRTNEFRDLVGGKEFEPVEANPMIGYRGCYRYVHDPELFEIELRALAEAREVTPNLHLMGGAATGPAPLDHGRGALGRLLDR